MVGLLQRLMTAAVLFEVMGDGDGCWAAEVKGSVSRGGQEAVGTVLWGALTMKGASA